MKEKRNKGREIKSERLKERCDRGTGNLKEKDIEKKNIRTPKQEFN